MKKMLLLFAFLFLLYFLANMYGIPYSAKLFGIESPSQNIGIYVGLAVFYNVLPLGIGWGILHAIGAKSRKKREHLLQTGTRVNAEIIDIKDTEVSLNQNLYVTLKLKVHATGETSFETEITTLVSRVKIPRVGDKIKVVYDPLDKSKMLIV